MLISRVSEEDAGPPEQDHDDYQTASQLFDLMAKNHPFDAHVGESLSARDLVILYKNIDLGTKLMSDAEEMKRRRPNQHVETVVYHDDVDSEGSDVSEIYGTDDNAYAINNERLDLFNGRPSLENILCQKLGDLEIQASNLSMEYDQHFLFKDPYIKEQLKNLNRTGAEFDGSVLPSSLLDYICCKRLEDNYNFYMENIIRYVKHTIEQLKRISNGDYLTDRAKEKWREVEKSKDEATKVLATSTSIPLQVERKGNGHATTWDDIIHSEVDIRSLSKILEKKIIVEVPKLICGSYKLFSKLCSDNLIISCKREDEPAKTEKKEPRVDVVLQLERSETGQVMSNISSMIIVQSAPLMPQLDEPPKPLPIAYIDAQKEMSPMEAEDEFLYSINKKENVKPKKVTIVEIHETDDNENVSEDNNDTNPYKNEDNMLPYDNVVEDYNDSKNDSLVESGDSSVALRDILDTRAIPDILRKEAPYDFISPDDLSLSTHKLNMSSLPEESCEDTPQNQVIKKKSQTKVRIKSPYENKSYLMEEKKRKKLLEIREKREKKKMAIGENCKVTKHRYGKGPIMPQPSSSVTKLSITNKSFYNSIYGQNVNLDPKLVKCKGSKGKRDSINHPLENFEGECESQMLTPDKNNQKYLNRSYYLDEAVTEMMYTQLRQSDCSSVRDIFSASPSAASGEFSERPNTDDQPEPMNDQPSDYLHENSFESDNENERKDSFNDNLLSGRTESRTHMISSSRSILNVVPVNSPTKDDDNNDNQEQEGETTNKTVPTVSCRDSIDKLYELMKKLGTAEQLEIKSSTSKLLTNISKIDAIVGQGSSIIQGSDSGTSLKHHLASSNPSSFSFEKIQNSEEVPTFNIINNKKTDALTTVVPKVIISTKQQTSNVEVEKVKKDRKRVVLAKVADNPLKAISQLLHEFDNVQKTRHRPPSDSKTSRKSDTPTESRNVPRQGFPFKKRSRIDQSEMQIDKNVKPTIPRDRRLRPNPALEPLKIPHQQIPVEEKHADRKEERIGDRKEDRHGDRAGREDKHGGATKKKIADLIDEVKEAKGEAVRGPSKLNTRLNSLAQPKKYYVQAHSEEYQTKYGRNLMADRLQRLASAPPVPVPSRGRTRRPGTEAAVSARPPPPPQPIERGLQLRRSASSSPEPRPPSAPPAHPSHLAPPPAPVRPTRAADVPDNNRKHKTVAVESHLKSHFRRAPPPALSEHTARAPLVPTELDLYSLIASSPMAEEATAIGSKLHRIIDSLLSAQPAPLAALVESREHSEHGAARDERSPARYSREPSSLDLDDRADIFQDRNVETAVESFRDKQTTDPAPTILKNYQVSNCSSTEIQTLEDALHGRLPVGAFQPRLRIKKLTLTPKQSMQQVLVVESGDAGSIVLKSTVSKSLKLTTSRSDATSDLNTLPAFDKSQLAWNIRSSIPMEIATVGYAFPEYRAAYCGSKSAVKSLDSIFKLGISVSSTSTKGHKKSDKTNQCFRGSLSKHATRDVNVSIPIKQDLVPVSKKPPSFASVATDAPTFGSIEKTCGDCSNVLKETCQKEAEELEMKGNIEKVDCTSSLDMLVGLLNEIQKITTCHITDTVQYSDKQECRELLDVEDGNAAVKDTVQNINSHELVSIASLDKLRQLESSTSIYSFYLSDGDKESIEEKFCIPLLKSSSKNILCDKVPDYVDKEVAADFPVKEYTNTFTEVPSMFFPITITHSTNVSKSLNGILSKPSSHTIISLEDFHSAYSDSTSSYKKIIEIEEEPKTDEICKIIELPIVEKQVETYSEVVIETNIVATEVHKVKSEINLFPNHFRCYKGSDLDPLIKIKRDILVTMYSMLVLTVFAALSFPEILYYV